MRLLQLAHSVNSWKQLRAKVKQIFMTTWEFEAIGTLWTIVVDGTEIATATKQAIQTEITRFDQTYSRFIPDSLVSRLANSPGTPITLDAEFTELLEFGQELATLTNHAFNINTASIQEAYGYDATYSFNNAMARQVEILSGSFTVTDRVLQTNGQVKFDFGAFGKGYLIDLVARLLEQRGHQHYLVDGGRDFYATSKATGQPWTIALEHPTQPNQAIGLTPLRHQGLACSSSHHRRVGRYHHLLHGQTGQPIDEVSSVFVLAKNAFVADGISTALFVSSTECWPNIVNRYPCEYLIVTDNLSLIHSQSFPGEIFE